MAKKQFRIQSISQHIEYKTKRLAYIRTPFLRQIVQREIDDLTQIEWLFHDKEKEIQQLQYDCNLLAQEVDKLKWTLTIFGLSDDEILTFSTTHRDVLRSLYRQALLFGDYKIPHRFQNNSLNYAPEI